MGVEGIGARVARKEDKRFITGKGRYTDDMVVFGMKGMPGIAAVLAIATVVCCAAPTGLATVKSITGECSWSLTGA